MVREFRLDGPRLSSPGSAKGALHYLDLIDAWASLPDSPTPRFAVSNIQIAGGRLTLVDQPTGLHSHGERPGPAPAFVSACPTRPRSKSGPIFSAQVEQARPGSRRAQQAPLPHPTKAG